MVTDSAIAEHAPQAQTAAPAPDQDREHAAAKPAPRVTGSADKVRARIASTAAPEVQADPQRWLARIVELRAAGDDATANAELERLRARYPDVTIPAAALPRTGTR